MNLFKNTWKPKKIVILILEIQSGSVRIFAQKRSLKDKIGTIPFAEFESIKELLKKFGKEQPLHIHVQGSGVLTRLVDFMPNYKEQLIVNGDKDDFYFCSFSDSYRVGISFFRKSSIETFLTELETEKVFLNDVSCGCIPFFTLIQPEGKIKGEFVAEMQGGKITALSRNEQAEYRIAFGGDFFDQHSLISQGIINSMMQESTFEGGFVGDEKQNYSEQYTQYSKFRFYGIALVSIILFALIGNYFYLNHLNNETAQLELDLSLNNENLSLLDRLQQEKTRKEQLILSSGINSAAFISYYLDEVGKTVPGSIHLTEMHVFPLKQKLKQKLKVEIDQQLIEVSGTTSSSEVLDDWIEKVNRFDWVDRVELLNYLKTEGSLAEFKFIIGLKK